MKYYTAKRVTTKDTTLTLQADSAKAFMYEEEDSLQCWGVDTEGGELFMAKQYPECEVTEVSYEQIKDKIENSRMYKDVKEVWGKDGNDLFEYFGFKKPEG